LPAAELLPTVRYYSRRKRGEGRRKREEGEMGREGERERERIA
jgi:hypothetical protein